jgi:hypothetical protein
VIQRAIPQRLKPELFWRGFATAEAVPFQDVTRRGSPTAACGSKEGAARRFVFPALKGGATLRRSAAQDSGINRGQIALLAGAACGSKEGAARRFVFLALKGGATLRRSAAQDSGINRGQIALLAGPACNERMERNASTRGEQINWYVVRRRWSRLLRSLVRFDEVPGRILSGTLHRAIMHSPGGPVCAMMFPHSHYWKRNKRSELLIATHHEVGPIDCYLYQNAQ